MQIYQNRDNETRNCEYKTLLYIINKMELTRLFKIILTVLCDASVQQNICMEYNCYRC